MLQAEKMSEIKKLAANIRKNVVLMIGGEGNVGHLGGSCSSADIVATLYGKWMKLDPENPDLSDRDKFIYSKGHAAIAQYAVLAELGYFPKEDIYKTKTLGSHLQGHPDRLKTPGIEVGTGSLGQGLSIAVGLAAAMKLDEINRRVYCIVGDGELAEGQIWEAAMSAVNYKLDNLIAFVDKNRLQATGVISERFATDPLPEKWEAFGWHVLSCDGHDIDSIDGAIEQAQANKGKPTVIIADTVKGKGISFAENVVSFHNSGLSKEQYEQALKELNDQIASA